MVVLRSDSQYTLIDNAYPLDSRASLEARAVAWTAFVLLEQNKPVTLDILALHFPGVEDKRLVKAVRELVSLGWLVKSSDGLYGLPEGAWETLDSVDSSQAKMIQSRQ